MIKHVVLLNWKAGTSEEQIRAVTEAFATLPALIPEIRSYQFGPDCGLNDDNADYVLVAEFANKEDFQHYAIHPEHFAVMKAVSLPILESFKTAQFEC